ncbi:MAG: hypothetical protein AAGI52_05205 [Bacteroidota bacterium]
MPSFLRLGLLVSLLAAAPALAQTGLGAQIGDPTGLTLKLGQGRGSIALAAGWDLGDGDSQLSVEGHYILRETAIPGEADLALFYGPGVFFQAREDEDTTIGGSLGIGLSLFATRDIEFYGLVSPRLEVIPRSEFALGGGIGARLFL